MASASVAFGRLGLRLAATFVLALAAGLLVPWRRPPWWPPWLSPWPEPSPSPAVSSCALGLVRRRLAATFLVGTSTSRYRPPGRRQSQPASSASASKRQRLGQRQLRRRANSAGRSRPDRRRPPAARNAPEPPDAPVPRPRARASASASRTGRAPPDAIRSSVPGLPGTARTRRPSFAAPRRDERARCERSPRPPTSLRPARRRCGCARGTLGARLRAGLILREHAARAQRLARTAPRAGPGRRRRRRSRARRRSRPPASSAPRCAAASIPSAPPDTIAKPGAPPRPRAMRCARRHPASGAARAPDDRQPALATLRKPPDEPERLDRLWQRPPSSAGKPDLNKKDAGRPGASAGCSASGSPTAVVGQQSAGLSVR